MEDISTLASVQEHKAKALAWATGQMANDLDMELGEYARVTASPIEAIFGLWWRALMATDSFARMLNLSTQHEVTTSSGRKYRLDVSVIPDDTDAWYEAHLLGIEFGRIGVEMDGHDFHERTKEQVAIRNQRDRDLQQDGWKILHFSGTELYRDPVRVVQEVERVGREHLNAMNNKLRAKKHARGDYGK